MPHRDAPSPAFFGRFSGGVLKSLSLLGRAEAATAALSFTFLQISDSHVGFEKAANPNALLTLQGVARRLVRSSGGPNGPAASTWVRRHQRAATRRRCRLAGCGGSELLHAASTRRPAGCVRRWPTPAVVPT